MEYQDLTLPDLAAKEYHRRMAECGPTHGACEFRERLLEAVTKCDSVSVRQCLERGADPNWGISMVDKCNPYTPMRMLVYCIDDSSLSPEEFEAYESICQMLLRYGGDRQDALRYAKTRYVLDNLPCPGMKKIIAILRDEPENH